MKLKPQILKLTGSIKSIGDKEKVISGTRVMHYQSIVFLQEGMDNNAEISIRFKDARIIQLMEFEPGQKAEVSFTLRGSTKRGPDFTNAHGISLTAL